jgi:hypothetical protein
MIEATFEQEGDVGVLAITTHFNTNHEIRCTKSSGETFRVGGTAISEVMQIEGLLLSTPSAGQSQAPFRAFKKADEYFEDEGELSSEDWTDDADRHCYVIEHYPLDMEGRKPKWLISRHPISEAHNLFVNVDVLDGGGNILKRYRISTFTGEYVVMEDLHA